MNRLKIANPILCVLFVLFIYSTISKAQEVKNNEGWNFKIGPDFYSPFVSGELTIEDLSGTFTTSLNYGGSIGVEAYSPKWSIISDLLYVSATSDVTLPASDSEANFEGKFILFGVYGMYRTVSWFDIGLGGRLIHVNADLFVDGVQQKDSNYPTGALLVVMRFNIFKSPKWDIRMKGDFGGFGIKSNWTYRVTPLIGYKFIDLLEIYLGFRVLAFSHVNENSATDMNIFMYGPKLGVIFHF